MPSRDSVLAVTAVLLLMQPTAYGAELLRDPTRPLTAPPFVPVTAATYSVSAIFVSSERRIAIVNSKRVSAGDKVDGATVLEIMSDGLRLGLQGKEFTIHILPAGLLK